MREDRRSDLTRSLTMGNDRRAAEIPGRPISKRRRLSIGDLFAFVLLMALGLSVVSCVGRSSLDRDLRFGFLAASVLFLGLLALLWQFSNASARRTRDSSRMVSELGFMVVLPMAFICMMVLAVLFPEGASQVVVITILLSIYATTWD
jgi:hypothetical protein